MLLAHSFATTDLCMDGGCISVPQQNSHLGLIDLKYIPKIVRCFQLGAIDMNEFRWIHGRAELLGALGRLCGVRNWVCIVPMQLLCRYECCWCPITTVCNECMTGYIGVCHQRRPMHYVGNGPAIMMGLPSPLGH